MIQVRFTKSGDTFLKCSISGHAGYAAYGSDIVCAAVTSAVQLTANTLTEIMHEPCQVEVLENEIRLILMPGAGEKAQELLMGLCQHFGILSEQYPDNIRLTVTKG